MSLLRIRTGLATFVAALAFVSARLLPTWLPATAPDGSLKCGQVGKSCEDMGMSPAGFTCSQGFLLGSRG